MEVNQQIAEGNYDNCYGNLLQNVKSESDQRQLLEFMESTKKKCLEIYEQRLREFEQKVTNKYNNQYQSEILGVTDEVQKDLLQAIKVNQVYSDTNRKLSEKLQESLIFGSIIYSVGDFRLKQEKAKQQILQSQNEGYKAKISKYQKETTCFVNMCKTKDDFIFYLKSKLQTLEKQLASQPSTLSQYSPPEFTQLSDSKDNQYKGLHSDSENSHNGSPLNHALEFDSKQQVGNVLSNNIEEMKPETEIIENKPLLQNDFDMYTYSFGKLFNGKSQQLIDDSQQNRQQKVQENMFLPTQFNNNNNQNNNQLYDQQLKGQQSDKISNIQMQKNAMNQCDSHSIKETKISLFNSSSDNTLSNLKKQSPPNAKKIKDKSQCNPTSVTRIKKMNSYSLSSNYGQNIFHKTDPQLINQMIIEPSTSYQQQKSQNIHNSGIITNNLRQTQQGNFQSISIQEGPSPRSFIIHKMGGTPKNQVSPSPTSSKKRI